MGYRRKKQEAKEKRRWNSFVLKNESLIRETGLTMPVIETEDHWADFLMHGCLDHHEDPTRFDVDELNEKQYEKLKELIRKYYEAGYTYITPVALRGPDQQRMDKEYASREKEK
jgi:hypothetical protein